MKTVYKGRVGEFNLEEARLPNGRTVQLEVLRHPGASAIVPLQEDGQVVMIRQYRHAAGGMIDEIPAGRLDPGEAPLDCARRELAEEVGREASQWDRLGAIWTTPGFTDEKIHLFLARNLNPVSQALEHDEVIEVVHRPLEEALTMIRRGQIMDGKTICALMLANFHIQGEGSWANR